MDLYSINGVEIFSVGKWNGDDYTEKDLQDMVEAFNDTKVGARPFIKLGHDKNQKLLQEDGLPAAGWIDKIYVQGQKLVADFVDIPSKVYDLIKKRAYRKVSSEIFWNISIGERKYRRLLGAVALLGADTPGVMNLSDILGLYNIDKKNYEKLSSGDELELKLFETNTNTKGAVTMSKTESEIKLEIELQKQKELNEKLESEKREYSQKLETEINEKLELKKFKAQIEIEKEELEKEKEKIRIEKFVNELCAEKLCTPAMKDLISEIVGPEKKEYSIKKLSKENAIKEMLKLFKAAQDVNFEENSSGDGDVAKNYADSMDKKIKEYMDQNQCSYGQAAKAVMKMAKK